MDVETPPVDLDLASRIAAALYASEQATDDVMVPVQDAYAEGVTGRGDVADHIGITRKQ